jgi:hypothetical protein
VLRARRKKLTPERRSEIARGAAQVKMGETERKRITAAVSAFCIRLSAFRVGGSGLIGALLRFCDIRGRLSRIYLLSLLGGHVVFTIQGTAKVGNEEGELFRVHFGAGLFCDESPIFVSEIQGHGGASTSGTNPAYFEARNKAEQYRSF